MKKKRILLGVLSAVLLVTASGCTNKDVEDKEGKEVVIEETEKEEDVVVEGEIVENEDKISDQEVDYDNILKAEVLEEPRLVKEDYSQYLEFLVTSEEGDDNVEHLIRVDVDNIIDLGRMEFTKDYNLAKGDIVNLYFKENTPITMSIPPQMFVDYLAVNTETGTGMMDINHYRSSKAYPEGLEGEDYTIENLEGLFAINRQGEEVEDLKELEDKDLLIFFLEPDFKYSPVKIMPEKIIVLD